VPPVTIDESDEQDLVVRPRIVTTAIVLWALDVIAYLGGAALVMGGHNAFVDAVMTQSGQHYTRDQVNSQLTIEEFASLGVGVLTAVSVYLLLKGNRWARVLLLICMFLQVICQTFFAIGITPIAGGTVLGLFGLLFLYLPRSNAYFAGLRRLA
jgi:hypothetical protein